MSGCVVIINQDGAPVSPQLLRRMTDHMAFRGPDAQEIWINGNVGLGHAMLKTTFESEAERQPFSLDGQVWITADARVDGRADLIRRLGIKDRDLRNAHDNELILHAYHAWGEDCVDHLIGDFAFAIWDARKQSLFCARDHFGVKPFYYAQVGAHLIISNTLNCIRLHPAVSNELNDQAIGDFLLIGSNEEPGTTFFADIKRLPAAHTLILSGGDLKVRRYWTLPIQDEIRYKRESDYVDHFVELLDAAVEDRLRTDRVGIFMSGGLDSSTVAATAHKIFSEGAHSFDLRAFTAVYDRLIPDEERHYSGLVADKLNIPIHYLAVDDYLPYERWDQPELLKPEPVHSPLGSAAAVDLQKLVASHCRVALTGMGGDDFLRPSVSYLLALLTNLRFGRFAIEVARHLRAHRRLPRIGFRTRLSRVFRRKFWSMSYPEWLNPGFASRLNLPERWNRMNRELALAHPLRPEAYENLTSPFWSFVFESYDPGTVSFQVESRHPLFDVRLVNYTLRLPSLPWCVDKSLMRSAMQGKLPEQVRRRPKTPVSGDPIASLLQRQNNQWLDYSVPQPELVKYVDWDIWTKSYEANISQPANVIDTDKLWAQTLPLSLDYWLQSLRNSEIFQARCSRGGIK